LYIIFPSYTRKRFKLISLNTIIEAAVSIREFLPNIFKFTQAKSDYLKKKTVYLMLKVYANERLRIDNEYYGVSSEKTLQ